MTISGNFRDETALTVFDSQIHDIMFQTKSRVADRICTRQPFSPGNKGHIKRITRQFSEGLAVELEERFAPVEQTHESRYDNRWITCKQHVSVEFVDDKDIRDSLFDPMGAMAKRQVERFNRKLDVDAIQSMYATVQIGGGEAPSGSLSFASDGGITVSMTSGATYEKLLALKETLIDNEVINEGDVNLYMGITGAEHTSFMNELELTSGDYTAVKKADSGEIQRACGIEFVRFGANATDPILPVSGGVRTSFCATDKAMDLYVQKEMRTEVEKANWLHNTWVVKTYMTYGFLRMDGRHIIKVTLTA